MTFEGFIVAFAQHGRYRAVVLEHLAFLMRYGHQPVGDLLRMPITFLLELSGGIGKILEQEKQQWQRGLSEAD